VRRPLWLVLLLLTLLLAAAWIGNAFVGGVDASLSVPIRVAAFGRDGKVLGEVPFQYSWLDRLELHVPNAYDAIGGIVVAVGDRQFSYPRPEFLRLWSITEEGLNAQGQMVFKIVAPSEVSAAHSGVPGYRGLINWPGDWTVLSKTAPARLMILSIVMVAAVLLVRLDRRQIVEGWIRQALLGDESPASGPGPSRWEKWGWLLAGGVVLVTAFIILEVSQPYFFSQDDNFDQFIPYSMHACRNVFSGTFPAWNPYQVMGSPVACTGFFLCLYPPIYLAYFLARYVFGNEYLMMEVYSIGHLTVGYLITYWMARKAGMRPLLSTVASLCFVLSGYFLIAGRGWSHFLPTVVWMPLFVIAVLELRQRNVGWRWAALTGLAIAALFYVGFPQNWGYALVCFLAPAGLWIVTGEIPLRRALWIIPALLFGLGLCTPLLFSLFQWIVDIIRPAPYGGGVEGGLFGTLLPYPLVTASYPDPGWGNKYREYAAELYYSGTLFCLVVFLAWSVLLAYRWKVKDVLVKNVWLVCAVGAMLVALGKSGLLWQLMSVMPLSGKSNDHPMRALPYFNLFAILGGGLILERLLQRVPRRGWEVGLAVAVAALLLFNASNARCSFYLFGDTPYPPMPGPMAKLLHPADSTELRRCMALAPRTCGEPGYCLSQCLGFPSIYTVLSMDAYDYIVEDKPFAQAMRQRFYTDPINAARAYGVRWVLVHNAVKKPLTGFCPTDKMIVNHPYRFPFEQSPFYRGSKHVLDLPEINLEVRELPGASPMAFAEAKPDKALPIRYDGAGVDVDVSGRPQGGTVVTNFLCWPQMVASADGKPAAAAPDDWGRVRVTVPAGTAKLEIRFRPPWKAGFLLGSFLAIAGAGIAAALSRPHQVRELGDPPSNPLPDEKRVRS
jgi:hypothetical protein